MKFKRLWLYSIVTTGAATSLACGETGGVDDAGSNETSGSTADGTTDGMTDDTTGGAPTEPGATEWIVSFSQVGDHSLVDLVVADNGDVYVAGSLTAPVAWGQSTLNPTSYADAFWAYLDPDGVPVYGRVHGGLDREGATEVVPLGGGDAVYAVSFHGAMNLGGETLNPPAGGYASALALDRFQGPTEWVVETGGYGLLNAVHGLLPGADQQVIAAGWTDTLDLFGVTISPGATEADPVGFLAAVQLGGTAQWFALAGWWPSSLAGNPAGEFAVAGVGRTPQADWDGQSIDAEGNAILISWFSGVGGHLGTRMVDGPGEETIGRHGLALDSAGRAWVCGQTDGPLALGDGVGPGGGLDGFVVRVDGDGSLAAGHRLADVGDSSCDAIAVDADDNVYVAGVVGSATSFAGTAMDPSGPARPWVAKLEPGGELAWLTLFDDGEHQIAGLAAAPGGGVVVAGMATKEGVLPNPDFDTDVDPWIMKLGG